jgi:hypothetical protein
LFVFADGIAVAPLLPGEMVVRFLGAQAYQVAQVARDRCEFRMVRGGLAASEMRFEEMTQFMRSMWWDGLQVDYRIVDEIPRPSPRGKISAFVREIELDAPDRVVTTARSGAAATVSRR